MKQNLTHKLGDQLKNHFSEKPSETQMSYLVYDIESIVDKKLLNEILHAGENLSDDEVYKQEVAKVLEEKGNTFLNPSFHVPVCLAAIAVDKDLQPLKIGLLGEKTPATIVKHFWDMYNRFNFIPVDFNGRGYDMRLLELWAFREGITIHYKHFDKFGTRYRYSDDKHLDLHEALTNNLAIKLQGGLNYFAKLLNKPGKMGVKGDMVQELYDKGEMFRIEDYCLGDALDTYFVFLRWMVVRGRITLQKEKELTENMIRIARDHSEKTGYLKEYLQHMKG